MSRDKPTGSFLARWSQRKRADEGQPVADPPERPAADTPETPAKARAAPEPPTDAEILAAHDLPDPDALKPGDDVTGFMAEAIPARLRNRALRKLWLSNPVLANLDELVDYGEDFTDAATVIENLQTVYQVGRGMLRDDPTPDPETPHDTDPAPEPVAAAAAEPPQTGAEPQSDPATAESARPVPTTPEGPPAPELAAAVAATPEPAAALAATPEPTAAQPGAASTPPAAHNAPEADPAPSTSAAVTGEPAPRRRIRRMVFDTGRT